MPEDTFSHAAADIDGKEEDLGIKYMKTLNYSVYKVQRNNKKKKKKKKEKKKKKKKKNRFESWFAQIYIYSISSGQFSLRTCKLFHAKTNLRACADSEGADQPVHPRGLIKAFTIRY